MALLFMILVHLTWKSTRSNCESDTCVEESSPTGSVLKRQDLQQNIAETSMSIKKWMDENDIKLTNDAWGKLNDHGFLSIDDLTSLPVNQIMDCLKNELQIKTADRLKLQQALNTLANKKNFIDPDELIMFQSMQATIDKLQNEVHGLKLKQTALAEHRIETQSNIDDEFEKIITSLNQRKTVLTQQLAEIAMRKNAEIETEISKTKGVIDDVRKMHDATNALLNTAISLDELNDRKTKIVQYQTEMNEKLKTKHENAMQINEKIGCVFDMTTALLQSINETGLMIIYEVSTPYSNRKSIRIDAVDVSLSVSVILDKQEKDILLQWMRDNVLQNDKSKQLKVSLLYRMSRDGRDLSVAHSKYNGKGPTLTIMQSRDYNHVCGGYTSKDWKATYGQGKDENAFIFLLRSQFGHQPKLFKPKDVNKAVDYSSTCGPSWGTGCTLRIIPQPGYDAYSRPDAIYGVTGSQLLGGQTYNKTQKTYSYWLKDYEVFQVSVIN